MVDNKISEVNDEEIFYGWKVVAAIFVLLTFSSGLSFYNHAIYLDALASLPAFNVQTASFAVSCFFLTGGFAGLWVAKWVQKYDPRWSISLGAVISFIALCILPSVTKVWQLFAVYSFFGIGFSAASLIPATTLVARWFHRRRAMALSIASTGLSLGGVVLTPLSVLMVESFGFAVAGPMMGVMYLLGVIPVALIWLRPDPASMGLLIDGDKTPTQKIEQENPQTNDQNGENDEVILDGITLKEARATRFFWGVSFGYIFLMLAQVGGIAHQYGLARELLSESQTAAAVAILPIASIIGRLVGGWIVERSSIRLFALGMMMLQAVSLVLLAGGFNAISLCIGLTLFGTSVGNLLMLQPLLIAEAFGVRDYARIFSICNLMSSWGTAAGPALFGIVYTMNQEMYGLSYAMAALAGATGLILFLSGGEIKSQST